jgi:hypothetical protein
MRLGIAAGNVDIRGGAERSRLRAVDSVPHPAVTL